jgi:hypothetical protein
LTSIDAALSFNFFVLQKMFDVAALSDEDFWLIFLFNVQPCRTHFSTFCLAENVRRGSSEHWRFFVDFPI